ncbi:hypothetical protein ABK040_013371 [Willaertia magna]
MIKSLLSLTKSNIKTSSFSPSVLMNRTITCSYHNNMNSFYPNRAKQEKEHNEEEKKEKIHFSFEIVDEEDAKKQDWYMKEKEAAKNFEEEEKFRTEKIIIPHSS